MTTLDCVEESVGRSVGSVRKAVGDPLKKCWNFPVEQKSVSVRFPVRGHIWYECPFGENLLVQNIFAFNSTGFEPMTSAMPVQCSNQLSYEVTQWSQVNLLGSCFAYNISFI